MNNNKEIRKMVRYWHKVFSNNTLQSETMQEFSTMESAAKALCELVTIDKKHDDNRALWHYNFDGEIAHWSYTCKEYRREVSYWEITLD